MPSEIYYVAGALALGSLVRSTFGFGDALVAMPLLLLLGLKDVATPVVAMASATVALLITIRDRRQINLASAWRLAAASCVGIPLGVCLFLFLLHMPDKRMSDMIVMGALATVIIGFASYRLFYPRLMKLGSDRWSFTFGIGFIAGILGGAYNIQGPPIVMYGVMRRWSAEEFHATLQGFFVPTTIVLLFCHWALGLWTTRVGLDFLVAFPLILLVIPIGKYFHRRLAKGRFDRYVDALLLLIGISLLVKVCWIAGTS